MPALRPSGSAAIPGRIFQPTKFLSRTTHAGRMPALRPTGSAAIPGRSFNAPSFFLALPMRARCPRSDRLGARPSLAASYNAPSYSLAPLCGQDARAPSLMKTGRAGHSVSPTSPARRTLCSHGFAPCRGRSWTPSAHPDHSHNPAPAEWSTGHTKTIVVVRVVRVVPVAIGRPAVPGVVVPVATTKNPMQPPHRLAGKPTDKSLFPSIVYCLHVIHEQSNS